MGIVTTPMCYFPFGIGHMSCFLRYNTLIVIYTGQIETDNLSASRVRHDGERSHSAVPRGATGRLA